MKRCSGIYFAKRPLMETPNKEPQEYSRNITVMDLPDLLV